MYSTETYIIILWWQLRYMSVICVIWYKINFTVFQNYWGPPSPPPLVSAIVCCGNITHKLESG
jgi:hypothetical protein